MTRLDDISVIIPHVPSRTALLGEALASVYGQERGRDLIDDVCIAADTQRLGAAATRQRALNLTRGYWVATLDDDDYFYPDHLLKLWQHARDTDADYVFSWFDRSKGGDPLGHFGKTFDPAAPHHTTATVLVKRDLAMLAGYANHEDANAHWPGEDWRFTLCCVELGAKIVHLPEETWVWRRHAGNTSGMPGKGDAK